MIASPTDPKAMALRNGAVADLHRMIGQAATDNSLHEQLASELGDLVRKLPHDVRVDVEDAVLKAAIDGDYANVIAQVGDYLAARLATEGV
jgi:exonuclease SbcD